MIKKMIKGLVLKKGMRIAQEKVLPVVVREVKKRRKK